tara:strand:- start:358 stop:612 length:255 start_codon:yes stop_codon:yes gene_type:complete
MDKELTIDDIKLIMRGKENMPLIYVSGYEDKDYKFMRKLVKDIIPDVGDDMYSTTQALKKIITTLRYFEDYDYEKLVQKIRGYC